MERVNEIGLAKPIATGILKLPPLPMYRAREGLVQCLFEAKADCSYTLRLRERNAGRPTLQGASKAEGRLYASMRSDSRGLRWIERGRRLSAPGIGHQRRRFQRRRPRQRGAAYPAAII